VRVSVTSVTVGRGLCVLPPSEKVKRLPNEVELENRDLVRSRSLESIAELPESHDDINPSPNPRSSSAFNRARKKYEVLGHFPVEDAPDRGQVEEERKSLELTVAKNQEELSSCGRERKDPPGIYGQHRRGSYEALLERGVPTIIPGSSDEDDIDTPYLVDSDVTLFHVRVPDAEVAFSKHDAESSLSTDHSSLKHLESVARNHSASLPNPPADEVDEKTKINDKEPVTSGALSQRETQETLPGAFRVAGIDAASITNHNEGTIGIGDTTTNMIPVAAVVDGTAVVDGAALTSVEFEEHMANFLLRRGISAAVAIVDEPPPRRNRMKKVLKRFSRVFCRSKK
jgi:hypothetical protein